MGEFIIGIILGLAFGFICGASFAVDSSDVINKKKAAIAECQSTLPRNQTCKYVITAVPEVAE